MNDLSNGTLILTFIGFLVAVIPLIWKMYVDASKKLNAASDKALQDQKDFYEKQITYQQDLINTQKADIDNLNKKYFELGSTLYPLVKETKTTIDGLSEILKNM